MIRFEEIAVGMAPEPLTMGPLSRTDIVRYQGASGDMNPIHHDEPLARAAGYPAPLAVGMLHAGAMAAHAAAWLGAENVRRTRIRWSEQVWPGDVLTIRGQVTKTYEEHGEKRADVEMECARQNGGVAARAWMTFAFPAVA
jgi:acyl dehydratase